jgi:hypothetical protein
VKPIVPSKPVAPVAFPLRGGPFQCTQVTLAAPRPNAARASSLSPRAQGMGGHFTHYHASTYHAVDFRCPVGTPVLAVAAGTVTEVKQVCQLLLRPFQHAATCADAHADRRRTNPVEFTYATSSCGTQ